MYNHIWQNLLLCTTNHILKHSSRSMGMQFAPINWLTLCLLFQLLLQSKQCWQQIQKQTSELCFRQVLLLTRFLIFLFGLSRNMKEILKLPYKSRACTLYDTIRFFRCTLSSSSDESAINQKECGRSILIHYLRTHIQQWS